jgi:hypothetical protein
MDINLNNLGIKYLNYDSGYNLILNNDKLCVKICSCECHIKVKNSTEGSSITHDNPCCVYPDKNNILHFPKN